MKRPALLPDLRDLSRDRLPWHLARWRRRLGWPGLAGMALLVLALGFELVVAVPERLEITELRERVAAAEEARQAGVPPPGQGPEAGLAAFYRALPPRASAGSWLEKIYAAGRDASLLLDKGEYKLNPAPDTRLARYEISLPVRGGYGQIRTFVDTVLRDIPAIALDDLQIRRGNITEGTLEARIRFVLYLREEG